ncbi:MAG: methyltransferase domain-containing protein [Actinomycetota bacterium]|nr:methyltransferase domain-containing protein [Actinomycetota bacterium]MDQ3721057.1 methyltransferase domain-containing protein [Actinomycetota bacterium]
MSAGGPAPIGVDVAGFLRSGLGLGEAARRYVGALRAAGVPVRTTTIEVPLPEAQRKHVKRTEFEDLTLDSEVQFNLVCVNAPELPRFYADVGAEFFAGRHTIGVWAWEVDEIPPDWGWSFSAVDEIWTYSDYVVDVLGAASGEVPVVKVPLTVTEPDPPGPPPDFGLPDRFTFLFLFDFYSTVQRKNPLGLIEAFTRAFEPGEGPQLLLKSFNGDLKPGRLREVRAAAQGHPDVHVVDCYVTSAERDALVAACDCFVSLHRAEGFGLGLAEAMALGRPVLATGFSGNVDFMRPENSWLARFRPTRVGPEGENYPPDGIWAEPDLDHAAQLMREIWESPELARERAERGRRDVLAELSPERVGGLARERLETLAAGPPPGASPPPPPPSEVTGSPLQRARWKLRFDPVADAREVGGVKGKAREAVLHAIRPFTHHQEELNLALYDALRDIAERLDKLGLDSDSAAHVRRLVEAARVRPSPDHPLIARRENGRTVLAFEATEKADATAAYRGFEDVFRGDEALVRRRQEQYADLLAGADWVLDIGCGRGEFLDLLRDRGQPARGVDLDEAMVARSREKGHEVERAEAVGHLRGLEDGSVPAAFSAQLIEHLGHEGLNALLRELVAKLRPGGTAILETMNPHLPSALKAFWVDPTHHHPLFPEVVLALGRFAGFGSGRVVFPDGSEDFDFDLYSSPDYAVVLTR